MKRFLLLVILAGACVSLAAQKWLPLRQHAEAQTYFKNAAAVVLLDSIGVNVRENGSGSFDIHHIVYIGTTAGALRHRVIKYDYDPLTAFAEFRSVKVYKPDGSFRDIDLSKAYDYAAPARAIYWGARQIMIEIGHLESGDIIDYQINKKGFTYALLADAEADAFFNSGMNIASCANASAVSNADDEERFVPPMRGHFYDIVPFWVSYPTVSKIYSIDMPRDKDIQYEFYQGECQSSIYFSGERKICRFAVNDARPFVSEPNMLDFYDVAPKLMLSSTNEWKDKSLWFNKVNEDFDSFASEPGTAKKVNELLKGKTGELEKIAVLTHWVADNIRYSGISMGKGEGYTLHCTEMNFTDRCGVCKDKAALLISMLRIAGFEAWPAMTMAGSRIEQIPADHFNHCVVVVKLSNGQYMPLDPTWVPFLRELWSSAEQQQNYLPGVPEGSDLQITPISAPENHYVKLNITTAIDADGKLKGEFTITAEGQSDGSIRRTFTSGLRAGWYNSLEAELLRVSPQAKLLNVDYGSSPRDYQAGPIKIKMRFEIPDYAAAGDGLLLCKLLSSSLYTGFRSYLRINTAITERKYSFEDDCSRDVEITETMTLPAGYRLQQDEQIADCKSEAADFEGSLAQDGARLTLKQRLILKKRVYEVDDWEGFRTAVNAYKDLTDKLLVFVK
ncbi:MAG: DUF3857 domain-containing protein [Tannerella sp.]|jgi:hypothetical protein|nr:DUF3857 domain-containing protein [Tannerella sp.]